MSTISSRPTAVENFLNAAGASIKYAAYWPASKSVDPQVAANAKKKLAEADRDFVVESQAGLRKTDKALTDAGKAIETGVKAGAKAVDEFLTDASKVVVTVAKNISNAGKPASEPWVRDAFGDR